MDREMKVKLAEQLGVAAKYRGEGDELSAEFLEGGVFSYCLGEWSRKISDEEKKRGVGVDRFEFSGLKMGRAWCISNRMS
jgi:hypothetical protein